MKSKEYKEALIDVLGKLINPITGIILDSMQNIAVQNKEEWNEVTPSDEPFFQRLFYRFKNSDDMNIQLLLRLGQETETTFQAIENLNGINFDELPENEIDEPFDTELENILYISEKLKEGKYASFHERLIKKLSEAEIEVKYLQNTKDIWCRDYMPVQISGNKFVQFVYNPIYLKDKKYNSKRTIPSNVWQGMGLNVYESKIVLDGGNVLKRNKKAIITDRILKDNKGLNEQELYEKIKSELDVETLIVIPELKGDMTGHSDGLVRFVNDDLVLMNDVSNIDKTYMQKLRFSLLSAGLKYFEIPNGYNLKQKNSIDDTGDYINFLELKDLVLIPAYNKEEDEQVLDVYRHAFSGKRVENIDCTEIAKQGGVLNCITWDIKQQILS